MIIIIADMDCKVHFLAAEGLEEAGFQVIFTAAMKIDFQFAR